MSARPRTLITGGAGVIGRILTRELSRELQLMVFDERGSIDSQLDVEYLEASVSDPAAVDRSVTGCTYVIHLARAHPQDWEHLLEVDIKGTRTVFTAAAAAKVERIVYASSNNVTMGYERDLLSGDIGNLSADQLFCRPRPTSEYAVAKLYGEALGRYVSDTSDTRVSCLRIGTVRDVDDPEHCVDEPGFGWIPGGRDAVLARLRATWLSHHDLVQVVREELAATEPFRLRYAVSDSASRFWPLSVITPG
jgi:nucleoside-diphosphate-sugar epimerase